MPCAMCKGDPDTCQWHPCNGCDGDDDECFNCQVVTEGFDCNVFGRKEENNDAKTD